MCVYIYIYIYTYIIYTYIHINVYIWPARSAAWRPRLRPPPFLLSPSRCFDGIPPETRLLRSFFSPAGDVRPAFKRPDHVPGRAGAESPLSVGRRYWVSVGRVVLVQLRTGARPYDWCPFQILRIFFRARYIPIEALIESGATTCLTLLVQYVLSSKVVSTAANRISSIRQVMP